MSNPVIDPFDDGINPDDVGSVFAYAELVLVCMNWVMRNCGWCQVGVVFEPTALENYNNRPDPTAVTESPLPAFGTLTEDYEQLSTFRFHSLTGRRQPLSSVCYHFTESELETKIQTPNPREATQTNGSPAETMC
ncbi:hypothetical protein EG68_05749 [Paragonimus skrjabini miyazakii]|uniref:Uncharacterized protein n=1 Tax=Paragonimus skrjabini miyazakii TaxID=59628 RepID=A0A8S9YTW8_9TREM|nr:hypothetical protein EG68_05749 [Paragonimus skrjabini miyazakii]